MILVFSPREELLCHPIVAKLVAAAPAHCGIPLVFGEFAHAIKAETTCPETWKTGGQVWRRLAEE